MTLKWAQLCHSQDTQVKYTRKSQLAKAIHQMIFFIIAHAWHDIPSAVFVIKAWFIYTSVYSFTVLNTTVVPLQGLWDTMKAPFLKRCPRLVFQHTYWM